MADLQNFMSIFEERFQALAKRITDYADLDKKVGELSQQCSSFFGKVEALDSDLKLALEKLRQRDESQGKLNAYLQIQIDSLSKRISDLVVVHQNQCQNVCGLQHEVSSVASKHIDLDKKLDQVQSQSHEHFKKHGDLKSKFESHQQFSSGFLDQIKEIQSFLGVLKGASQESQKSMQLHDQKLNELMREIVDLKSNIDGSFSFFRSKVDERINSILMEVDKRVKSISVPDVSRFMERGEVEELKHSIALSSLDSKNAAAKSNNNEIQNQIMNKKLEGLLIQLKSLEFIKPM